MGNPHGLFFFWDTLGIPLDISILHLKKTLQLNDAELQRLVLQFILDATNAGWKPQKIKSDLREASSCGDLKLETWITKLNT